MVSELLPPPRVHAQDGGLESVSPVQHKPLLLCSDSNRAKMIFTSGFEFGTLKFTVCLCEVCLEVCLRWLFLFGFCLAAAEACVPGEQCY